MNLYSYFFDITPVIKDIDYKFKKKGAVIEVYRRYISLYLYRLHGIYKTTKINPPAVSIIENEIDLGGVFRVQNKVRLFAKNRKHLSLLLTEMRRQKVFKQNCELTDIQEVPANICAYEITKRVRIPSVASGDEVAFAVAQEIKNNPNNNYLNFMVSSSFNSNKKFLRYYYTKIPVSRDNYRGKLDGYGFSRKKNTVCVPSF